jgi:DNA-binding NarL/FixJ family response regulator
VVEILIAAKDKLIRSSLALLVKYQGRKDTVKDSADPINFLEILRNFYIDLVIIDWEFFFDENFEMMSLLKKAYPGIAFIVTGIKKENKKDVILSNMDGFYLQSDSPEELIKIIDRFRKNERDS